MMSWRKSRAVSEACLSSGKVGEDAALFFAAEGRIGQDDVHAIFVADFLQWKAEAVEGVDLGRFQSVEEEVHLREQIRKRFGFPAQEAFGLEDGIMLGPLALFSQMVEGFDQEAAGAAGGIEKRFAQSRIGDGDHEADDGARGVELA